MMMMTMVITPRTSVFATISARRFFRLFVIIVITSSMCVMMTIVMMMMTIFYSPSVVAFRRCFMA